MSYRRILGRRGGRMAVLICVVLIAVLASGRGRRSAEERGSGPAAAAGGSATVIRVVDGDTIVASIGGDEEYVRYIGVDTPESVKPGTPVQCFGERASHFNQRLVEGRRVRLVYDREMRDVYGRLLAYVYVRRRFVNAILVRRGLARALTISPNDSHAGLFERLEAAAGRAGRGLWGSCPLP